MNKKINMILLKIYPKLFWYSDGRPKRCTDCFHDEFVETATDNLNGIVCESYFNCKKCGAFAQEWGYGYYNTNNMEPSPWWYIIKFYLTCSKIWYIKEEAKEKIIRRSKRR